MPSAMTCSGLQRLLPGQALVLVRLPGRLFKRNLRPALRGQLGSAHRAPNLRSWQENLATPGFNPRDTLQELGKLMVRPPNYSQDKKRREEASRKKREEKEQRRRQKKDEPPPPTA